MANRRRTIQLHFMVNQQERDCIREKMAQLGTDNLGAYLRKMALDGLVVRLDLPELRELLALLRRTSANVNQIAQRVHQTGRVYEDDLGDILQKQDALWETMNQLLTRLGKIS